MTSDKIFLVKEKDKSIFNVMYFIDHFKIIELTAAEIERLKDLLNGDIQDWKESGDIYAENREIKEDKNLLKKLSALSEGLNVS